MITRQDYMSGKASHEDFYRQFVTDEVKRWVERDIGLDRIRKSKDPHLNDIRLFRWDAISYLIKANQGIADALRSAGDFWSLAVGVCIAKQAARMLLEESTLPEAA